MAADLTTYDVALKEAYHNFLSAKALGFESVMAYIRWRNRQAAIQRWQRTGALFYID